MIGLAKREEEIILHKANSIDVNADKVAKMATKIAHML
jgi:hypothetical protein